MRFIHSISIRAKIIVIAMICTCSALLTAILFDDIYENRKAKQRSMEELNAIAKIIADRSTAALSFGDEILAQQNLKVLQHIDSIEYGCLYNANTLFVTYSKNISISSCPEKPTAEQSTIVGQNIYVNKPVLLDDTAIGSLYLASSLANLQELFTLYLAVSVGFSCIGAALALFLATHLQSLITRPINALQKTASRVRNDKAYSLRAEKYGNDEVGGLVEAFNDMLSRIESDNAMLRESEHRFRTLTASSPFGVFQTNRQGDFFYVNERWREISKIFDERIDTKFFSNRIHPDDREETCRSWDEASEQKKEFKAEFRLQNNDNEIVDVICQAKPILTANGKLDGFLGSLADISELKLAQSQLEKLALYDSLTNLANRHLFRNRLHKAIRSAERNQQKFALLFLDFDQFKRINDTMGHDQGDQLLIVMAQRLRSCLRARDTVARLGGDEFTILIPEMTQRHEIDIIARKLLFTLKEPIQLTGHEVILTCSIGITICPDDGNTVDQLMRNADMAMYKSKNAGRDGFFYFSEDINQQIRQQLEIESELRKAIKRDEFRVFYQPKIDLSTNSVIGYEALIRWEHPQHGLLGPINFISVAEDVGLILPMGKWVLKEVCKTIRWMLDDGFFPEKGKISVNLSVKQFRDPNLVTDIANILNEHTISASYIELEITESLLMDDVDQAIDILSRLRAIGITLSIDDFGTGYSSFNYLKRLPIDLIKVDRSFVKDIPQDKDDMEITSAVIAMAHKLGLQVVAEGVETVEQMQFLNLNHCDFGQGYLFGKPNPMNIFVEQLNSHNTAITIDLDK